MNSLIRPVAFALAVCGVAALALLKFDGVTNAQALTSPAQPVATIIAPIPEINLGAFIGPPYPDPVEFMGPPYPETEEDLANQVTPPLGWVANGDGC